LFGLQVKILGLSDVRQNYFNLILPDLLLVAYFKNCYALVNGLNFRARTTARNS